MYIDVVLGNLCEFAIHTYTQSSHVYTSPLVLHQHTLFTNDTHARTHTHTHMQETYTHTHTHMQETYIHTYTFIISCTVY